MISAADDPLPQAPTKLSRKTNASRNRATQRAQNLQSFSAFMQYLTSADSAQQELAIKALRHLGNCDVAALAAGLNPSGGTREGLRELKRIASISPDAKCDFADTVWDRIFVDTNCLSYDPAGWPPADRVRETGNDLTQPASTGTPTLRAAA